MAKKKTPKTTEDQEVKVNTQETEVVETTVETPASEETEAEESKETEDPSKISETEEPKETEEEPEEEEISEQVAKEDMLPDHVKRALRKFPNMKELYISRSGGVFTPDTQPSLRGKAILYQNPYYKS